VAAGLGQTDTAERLVVDLVPYGAQNGTPGGLGTQNSPFTSYTNAANGTSDIGQSLYEFQYPNNSTGILNIAQNMSLFQISVPPPPPLVQMRIRWQDGDQEGTGNSTQIDSLVHPDFVFDTDINGAAIPEPSSLVLLTLGSIVAWGFRGFRGESVK
jgi:hypothetical protein